MAKNLRRVHFSVKMYVKTKEIDPVGEVGVGGHALAAPPGSANASSSIYLSIYPENHPISVPISAST